LSWFSDLMDLVPRTAYPCVAAFSCSCWCNDYESMSMIPQLYFTCRR